MSLGECRDYFDYGLRPESDGQILHEIDWFQQLWKTSPKVFLRYDRIALFSPEDPQLRVTFDHNLCWRDTQLQLSCGDWGHPLLTGSQRDQGPGLNAALDLQHPRPCRSLSDFLFQIRILLPKPSLPANDEKSDLWR